MTRTSDRKALDIFVEGRMRTRSIYAELVDVSEGGCKLKGKPGFAKVEDTVTFKVNGIRVPMGKVVWVDGSHAGIAFDGQMHPAVIDHLCRERLQQRLDNAKRRAG